MEWYYVDPQHQRQGPVAREALAGLYRNGALTAASLVWREGLGQWTPLGELAAELGLPAPAPAVPAAAPDPDPAVAGDAEEDRPLTGRAVFTAREPSYAPPAAVRAATAGAASAAADASPYTAPHATIADPGMVLHADPGHVVQAGFWKRVAAYFIDYFITSLIGGVVGAIIGAVMGGALSLGSSPGSSGFLLIQLVSGLVGFAISVTYFSWFHSSALQATPGKLAIGIKVVRGNGEPISFLRGVGRCFAMILSGLILCIGYVMAAFTERKQGLHDLMCDTLVVDKWAYTRYPERQREELGVVTWVVLALVGLLVVVMLFGFVALLAALGGR